MKNQRPSLFSKDSLGLHAAGGKKRPSPALALKTREFSLRPIPFIKQLTSSRLPPPPSQVPGFLERAQAAPQVQRRAQPRKARGSSTKGSMTTSSSPWIPRLLLALVFPAG